MSAPLHPDWPVASDGKHYWDQPDPIADLISALDCAGATVALDDIAAVTEYDVTSDDGKWAPGGTVATELSMTLLGMLRDGRWFALEAGNDYTGWGCQDFADLYIGATREDVIANGLTTEGRNTLGVSLS